VRVRRRTLRGAVLAAWFWFGAAWSGALVPARAHAAVPGARTARADSASSQRTAARRLVLEGDGLYAKQSYAQALERYAEAPTSCAAQAPDAPARGWEWSVEPRQACGVTSLRLHTGLEQRQRSRRYT